MSKAENLSKLVSAGGIGILNTGQITAAELSNLATVAVTGSYTDLSNKLTTDTLPAGTISGYSNAIKQFALIHIIRG